jgi:hypothetical protein
MGLMGVSSTILRASTSLRLGERVVVRCVDGALAAEYALFDAGEIVLRSSDPVTVREMGYITTARQALARLARAGVTPELAQKAASSLPPGAAASYARGASVRALAQAGRLGPQELFDGAVYRAATQSYDGAWLQLPPLSAALGREAAWALQALHLAAVLAEVTSTTPLQLATANLTRTGRSGERTYRRVSLDSARELPAMLRELQPNALGLDLEPQADAALRDSLLVRVRERMSADAGSKLRAHLEGLESALTAGAAPRSPMEDPELRDIDRQLASGDANGVDTRLDDLERLRGRIPGIRYLRARVALVRGDEPPQKVAQTLSALAGEQSPFHEAELVAARAWLAAGEDAHARYFARRLADDATATESARLVALEILEETNKTTRSNLPPAVRPQPQAFARAVAASAPARALAAVPAPPPSEPPIEARAYVVESPPPFRRAPPGASLPPLDGSSEAFAPPGHPPPRGRGGPGVLVRVTPPVRYDPEIVESLALPHGADEESLPVGHTPTTPLQARIAMTRLARTIGRDYRLWYGASLRCNVIAIDLMQRHLVQRYSGASLADPKTTSELLRHGALLSEIVARALGGVWIDVGPSECGYWAMNVPPATRFWPIGRVYRFVALGHLERDLVAYYLDLEKRVRGGVVR